MITYQRLAGSTDVSVTLRIIDSTDGTPETGVIFSTAGIDLEYRREGAASVDITEVTLAALTTAHTDGGFLHIGNGYYRLDLPDAACAAGATGVLIHGTVTGMVVIGCYIELVAYNPYDAVRLGLTALPNAAAGAPGGLGRGMEGGTAQAGAANSITLRAGASGIGRLYAGEVVEIVGGTGIGQARTIVDYNGTTKVATVGRPWLVNPDATSVYELRGPETRPWPLFQSGTAQAGAANSITLASVASAADDTYNGSTVRLLAGTGAAQIRVITDYVGATKVATVAPAWQTAPDATSVYAVEAAQALSTDGAGLLSAGNVAAVQAGLATAAALATVQADTDDIQTRLPAALVAGRMASDAVAISGSTAAADAVEANIANLDATTSSRLATAGYTAPPTAAANAVAVWNEPRAGHVAAGSFGEGVASVQGNVTGSVASVTADVGITQAGADKVWASAARTLTAFGFAVDLSATALAAIWNRATSALTTIGSIGKLLVDNIDAAISSRLATAGYTAPPTAAANADAMWDEALAGHLAAGSTGEALNAAGGAGDPWVTALPGAYGAGSAGFIVGTNLNGTVASRASQASVDDLPTNAELATALGTADDATLAAIAALNNLSAAQVNAEVDTALADARLDELLAADSDIDGVAPPVVGSVFHELLSKTAGSFTYDQTTDSLEALADSGGGGPTAVQIRQEIDTNSTQLAAIVADTNELQSDWVDAGRLDTILDARASQVSVNDLPTNAELATALGTADDATLAAIAALNDVTAAEVVTALKAGTIAELTAGAFPATPTIEQALSLLIHLLARGGTFTKATGVATVRNSAGGTIMQRTDTDDGFIFTEGALGAP